MTLHEELLERIAKLETQMLWVLQRLGIDPGEPEGPPDPVETATDPAPPSA